MNNFQKRALAYKVYRALRKMAAVSKADPTQPVSTESSSTDDSNTTNKKTNNWAGKIRMKGDYYRAFQRKRSDSGGGKKGCC